MHHRNQRFLAIGCALLALSVAACDDKSDKLCDENATACNADGTSLLTCKTGEWIETACESKACVFSTQGAICLDKSKTEFCTPNESGCTEAGLVKKCGADLRWHYTVCDAGMTCKNGSCVEGEGPNISVDDAERTCSADGRGIDYKTESGIVTRSCFEETGIDSMCVTYSNGLVGCSKPAACTDVFSEAGTCIGNRLAYCDLRYTNERPELVDCLSLGKVCATIDGKANCHDICEANEPEFSCTKSDDIEYVKHCAKVDGSPLRDVQMSLCDGNTAVTCSNGSIKRTTCPSGSQCVASLGTCVATCSESKKDDAVCDANNNLSLCQKTPEGVWAYVPVGGRECVGNTLNRCENGAVKTMDCVHQEYRQDDGTLYSDHGRCVKDMQFYADYDICYPVLDGEPCGDLTDQGVCNGNILSYCDADDHYKVDNDCSKNKYGLTSCTSYKGYSDCREPCTQVGEASCEYQDNGDGTGISTLLLCVPDENDASKLTVLIASHGCIGNTSYSCDKTTVIKTDCASNGGVCGNLSCEYPMCTISSSETCENNLMCSIKNTDDILGHIEGMVNCS